jgi:hypothetical protein
MLAGVTFAEMTVAFLFLRIDFAVLLALLVAVVDALPVVGSGAVLIPWALVSLIGGNNHNGGHAGRYLRRQYRRAQSARASAHRPADRLAADRHARCDLRRLQRHGRGGHARLPLGLIMVKHLNDKGYIKLWKQ